MKKSIRARRKPGQRAFEEYGRQRGVAGQQGKTDMKHTGFISAVVLAAIAVTATPTFAMGPRGGHSVTFEELDADGNGEVSKAEMEAHRTARFDKADTDGDGKLSVDEMQAAAQERAKQMASAMFERHDANKDGFLTEDELPKPRREGKMFDRMDADGDGSISAEEFANVQDRMEQHREKRGHGWFGKN